VSEALFVWAQRLYSSSNPLGKHKYSDIDEYAGSWQSSKWQSEEMSCYLR